ncbi:hypothetical protein FDP41_000563 [Naegleria fowleri]|uniref:Uncharacterized protein n=1 Tax=Naegleria fowleri TaxID=5763 RepID=A0A6A5CDL8_NAEFO|nr:uncharacterized protein FDP41_000563 [Naegleria fowleri]KAF0984664.1 hypothetical protein FDP41_000563 [Naegleria fowleri]
MPSKIGKTRPNHGPKHSSSLQSLSDYIASASSSVDNEPNLTNNLNPTHNCSTSVDTRLYPTIDPIADEELAAKTNSMSMSNQDNIELLDNELTNNLNIQDMSVDEIVGKTFLKPNNAKLDTNRTLLDTDQILEIKERMKNINKLLSENKKSSNVQQDNEEFNINDIAVKEITPPRYIAVRYSKIFEENEVIELIKDNLSGKYVTINPSIKLNNTIIVTIEDCAQVEQAVETLRELWKTTVKADWRNAIESDTGEPIVEIARARIGKEMAAVITVKSMKARNNLCKAKTYDITIPRTEETVTMKIDIPFNYAMDVQYSDIIGRWPERNDLIRARIQTESSLARKYNNDQPVSILIINQEKRICLIRLNNLSNAIRLVNHAAYGMNEWTLDFALNYPMLEDFLEKKPDTVHKISQNLGRSSKIAAKDVSFTLEKVQQVHLKEIKRIEASMDKRIAELEARQNQKLAMGFKEMANIIRANNEELMITNRISTLTFLSGCTKDNIYQEEIDECHKKLKLLDSLQAEPLSALRGYLNSITPDIIMLQEVKSVYIGPDFPSIYYSSFTYYHNPRDSCGVSICLNKSTFKDIEEIILDPIIKNNARIIGVKCKINSINTLVISAYFPNQPADRCEFTYILDNLIEKYPNYKIIIGDRITTEEKEWIIQNLKSTAPNELGLRQKTIKYMCKELQEEIFQIIENIITTGFTPESMQSVSILPIHKKNKDHSNPANYRPIALMDSGLKIATKLITKRLKEVLKGRLSLAQFGGEDGRETIHRVLSIYNMIAWAKGQETFYGLAVDIKKLMTHYRELCFVMDCYS